MSKIKLFTHTDLDGIGCAILAYLAFGRENVDVEYCDYSNVNDKVGDLVITENDYFSIVNTRFEIKNDAGKIIKVYACSSIEGDVFNNIVWLYEEDRKKAAELLCNNQKKLIKDLKEKIASHGELVDMLEKEMEN